MREHSEAYIRIQKRREAKRIKAIRRRNRFIVKLVTTFSVIMITALLFGRFTSYAGSAKEAKQTYKYYTSICVAEGDTLTSIANEYMSDEFASVNKYIDEVVAINHLDNASDIKTGNNIIVPYYSEEYK